MQLEIQTQINEKGEIHLQLPPDTATKKAKVIIIYEEDPKPMTLGLFKGQIQMAEDFDAPLSEDFWLKINLYALYIKK